MRPFTVALIGLLALCALDVSAKEDPDPKALAKLAGEDPKKAAAGIEKLLTAARRARDLPRQLEVGSLAFALVPMVDRRPEPAAGLLHLRKWAGPRAYAEFSAHVLVDVALLTATERGEYAALDVVLKLAAKRGTGAYGTYARALGQYGKGISMTEAGKHAEALAAFAAVLEACSKNGWARLATHAGIEKVLAASRAGDSEAVEKVLSEMLAAVREDADASILVGARSMAAARLAEEYTELHAAWKAALTKRLDAYSGKKGSGVGGAGRSRRATPIATALTKWKKSKPLVVVTRNGDAFHIEYRFGKLEGKTHKLSPGITHVDEGGLVLAFWQAGVRLQQVCPQNEAVNGVNAAPGMWQHFDPLALGETWSLYATGEIRIK